MIRIIWFIRCYSVVGGCWLLVLEFLGYMGPSDTPPYSLSIWLAGMVKVKQVEKP